MNKELKAKFKDGVCPISAQDYARIDRDELKEIVMAAGLNFEEYEKNSKKLWPKEFTPKLLTWRKR